jgi:ketosteroid isomerase-like protein
MTEHPNAAIFRYGYEAMLAGDLATFRQILAPGVIWHQPGMAEPVVGRAAVIDLLRAQEIAGVDASLTQLHDVMSSTEHVCALVRARLRCGDLSVSYLLNEVAHMREGLVTERWAFTEAAPPEVTVFFSTLATAAQDRPAAGWLAGAVMRRRRAPRAVGAPLRGSAGSGAPPE